MKKFSGIILGIDPSLRSTGLALVEFTLIGQIKLLDSRTIKIKAQVPQVEAFGIIGRAIDDYLINSQIKHVAIESTIYVQNMQTAQIMAATRGVCIVVPAIMNVPVFEYAPKKVKQMLTGKGDADKETVARFVKSHTGVDLSANLDESDAAAIAICHGLSTR